MLDLPWWHIALQIVQVSMWTLQQHSIKNYRQTSNIRCTNFRNLNVSPFVLQLTLPNPLKPGVKSRMKMLQVGAAPAGNAPTTSEWSTILMLIKVRASYIIGFTVWYWSHLVCPNNARYMKVDMLLMLHQSRNILSEIVMIWCVRFCIIGILFTQ